MIVTRSIYHPGEWAEEPRAVGVLIFVIVHEEHYNELLAKTLADFFEDYHDHDDGEPKKE